MTAHPTTATPSVHVPETLSEAVELLRGGASVLAGGTWIMRGSVRGDGFAPEYVLISRLPELNRLEFEGDRLVIGAGVSHDRLAAFLAGDPRFDGLQRAARKSANPAIRRMATVGGNLCTTAFAAADLPPALIAVAAEVEVVDAEGARSMSVPEFLAARDELLPGVLVSRVSVPIPNGLSMHERLTMRQAGDYPMGIVNIHVALDDEGVVQAASVAVGSVEQVPFAWHALASELVGSPLDAEAARTAASALTDRLNARDGVEAAGWYRLQILPALVGNAVRTLQRKAEKR
jgi:carbon-monoxide dehydrogenase medium subunit